MQIPPSIISGHNGFQSAQTDLTQATVDVASSSQSVSATTTANCGDKSQALLSMVPLVSQAQAAADIIDATSETIGSIINIKV
ncbi:chemotaxis protein [Shewanella youngdeokensis]|uniref:Chemotaxis protein n=1 Tax=Shewanella youngdeokensis TaxID=2999068 RepID=A0ABZ0K267_9GAMM|nr:chemotaxis protein [Shewanella sp. DAU334]